MPPPPSDPADPASDSASAPEPASASASAPEPASAAASASKSAAAPAGDSEPAPLPPDSPLKQLPWPSLDQLGLLEAIGGLFLGLIALLSSYDHVLLAGCSFPLPQQWGIPFIAASVATIFIDAELASRSRLRAEDEAARARNRTARSRKRQARELALLRRSALLSARVQLDPSTNNRERLRLFLALMEGQELAGS